jgi:hypothetical protein
MTLQPWTEYAFYNPKTDRIIVAIFSDWGDAAMWAKDDNGIMVKGDIYNPVQHWIPSREAPLDFTGKYGYILLGEVD